MRERLSQTRAGGQNAQPRAPDVASTQAHAHTIAKSDAIASTHADADPDAEPGAASSAAAEGWEHAECDGPPRVARRPRLVVDVERVGGRAAAEPD